MLFKLFFISFFSFFSVKGVQGRGDDQSPYDCKILFLRREGRRCSVCSVNMHTFDTQLITVGPRVPAAAVPDAAAGGSRECPGRRLCDTMPGGRRGARHTFCQHAGCEAKGAGLWTGETELLRVGIKPVWVPRPLQPLTVTPGELRSCPGASRR